MAEFSSDGVRLHFALHGPDDGVPTVLLHGYASDYELNWVGTRWQEMLVKAERLVVGLDQRGHGQSDKPHDPAAYDQRLMAADVLRLLDHLGIAEADCVGYSMGARIGLRLAVDSSNRLGRAVLGGLGTIGGFAHAELIARRMRGDASVTDPVATTFFEFAAARPINDLEALAACILGPPATLSEAELRRTANPILVAAGERDELADGASEIASRLPQGSFLELPGRDHMNAVPSKQFKEAALQFLERTET